MVIVSLWNSSSEESNRKHVLKSKVPFPVMWCDFCSSFPNFTYRIMRSTGQSTISLCLLSLTKDRPFVQLTIKYPSDDMIRSAEKAARTRR